MSEANLEKLDAIWKDDLLGRRAEAEWLEQYLSNASSAGIRPLGRKSFIININGEWGSGKTFFIDRFQKHLEVKGHLVAKLDAWRADPSSDPIVSLVACIEKCIEPYVSKKIILQDHLNAVHRAGGRLSKLIVPALAKQGLKRFLGRDGFEGLSEILVDELSGANSKRLKDAIELVGDAVDSIEDDVLDSYTSATYFSKRVADSQAQFEAIQEFSKAIEELLKSLFEKRKIEAPLYVFVDELDRCRPTFAIEVLERINHLFDLDGIVFLVCTDSEQLAHSIKAIYGAGFSSNEYLGRFFSFRYELNVSEKYQLFDAIISEFDIDLSRLLLLRAVTSESVLRDVLCELVTNSRHLRQVLFLIRTYLIATDKKVDGICLFAEAVAVFYQYPEVFVRNRGASVSGEDRTALDLRVRSCRIRHDKYNGKKSDTHISDYVHEMRTGNNKTLRDLANGSPLELISSQKSQLAKSQIAVGDSLDSITVNWDDYTAELKTSSRLQQFSGLIDAE